jgi:flagellar L-ring protein precursor FlgH
MIHGSTSRSVAFAILACTASLCAGPFVRIASAQNGSLLHAPLTGRVVDDSPRAVAQLPYPQQTPQWTPNQTVPLQSVPQPGADGLASPRRSPVVLSGASWTYQPAPPTRVFRKKDIVTIRVDEITRMAAEGSAENRKRTLYEAILTDWIGFHEFRLKPDAQSNGDPSVGTESNSIYRAESNVESRESMAFNIAATVVDVRPNGNMVLEARKKIRVNDNLWETSLTGICRAEDIAPDNVILSKDLIDLEIGKADRGHLRDGYKRGWFQRWFDRVQPF